MLLVLYFDSAECREDPGALTSWNPMSHSRLVAEKPLTLPLPLP